MVIPAQNAGYELRDILQCNWPAVLPSIKLVKDKEKLKNGPRLKESKGTQPLNAIKIITGTIGEIQIKDVDELTYSISVNFLSLITALVLVKNSRLGGNTH